MPRKERESEKKLVKAAAGGDEEAFATLVAPYKAKIYRLCFGIVHDHEIAEDVTQDAFLHAYQHLKNFKGQSQFYTWLYKIGKNLSLNAYKKRKRQKEKEKRFLESEKRKMAKRLTKHMSTMEMEEDECRELISKGLDTLSIGQKLVFELYILEGKKHAEIAKELGIPEGTARSRLFYARRQMQRSLREFLK